MLLQADAAGETNMIHWAGSSLTQRHPSCLPLLYFSPLTLFSHRNISVSSLPCCFASLSHPLFLPLRLLSPDLGAARTFQAGPVSTASSCLSCCLFYVMYYIHEFRIRSGVFLFVFSLPLSLPSLCWLSLLLILHLAESLNRGVPPVSWVLLKVSSC